jgi:hypothetical protein
MAGRTGFITFNIKGIPEVQAALKNVSRRMGERWVRGAVAEGANVYRDTARQNAIGQGLSVSGRYPTTPGGRMIDHRGMIPFAIRAWVEPATNGRSAVAGVRVVSGRRKSPTQTYHWHFVEFGGPNNPVTRPFWVRSFSEAQQAASAAAAEVILRQVKNANAGKA